MYYIGLDIGGTKTAVLLVNEVFETIGKTQFPTHPEQLVSSLVKNIHQLLREHQISVDQLCGMGVGIPGLVDNENGLVKMAVNLEIFEPFPLAHKLSSAFNVPVAMENDVRLAAIGLHKKRQVNNLVYLNLGTGIAAGVVLNGRLHRGASGGAGEIGHIPLPATENILEHNIAGPGIIRQANELALNIEQAGELYQLAAEGNLTAQQLIQSISQIISQTILWLIMMFDVDVLFMGGGVTKIGEPFLTPILDSLASARSYSQLAELMVTDDKIQLLPSHFNAGLWGAVEIARQQTL